MKINEDQEVLLKFQKEQYDNTCVKRKELNEKISALEIQIMAALDRIAILENFILNWGEK